MTAVERAFRLPIFCAIATLSTACGSHETCTTAVIVAPIIRVVNATTGAQICNATITYQSDIADASQQLLVVSPDDGGEESCAYVGLDQAGSYLLTVTAPGFQATTSTADAKLEPGCGGPNEPAPVIVDLPPS